MKKSLIFSNLLLFLIGLGSIHVTKTMNKKSKIYEAKPGDGLHCISAAAYRPDISHFSNSHEATNFISLPTLGEIFKKLKAIPLTTFTTGIEVGEFINALQKPKSDRLERKIRKIASLRRHLNIQSNQRAPEPIIDFSEEDLQEEREALRVDISILNEEYKILQKDLDNIRATRERLIKKNRKIEEQFRQSQAKLLQSKIEILQPTSIATKPEERIPAEHLNKKSSFFKNYSGTCMLATGLVGLTAGLFIPASFKQSVLSYLLNKA